MEQEDDFVNCAIVNQEGIILSIGYGFHLCTKLKIGHSIFDHIDDQFGDQLSTNLKLSAASERLPLEIKPIIQQMVTSSGYKYLLVVAKYLNHEKTKVLIPQCYINNVFCDDKGAKQKVVVKMPYIRSVDSINSMHTDEELEEMIESKCLRVLIVDDCRRTCKSTARLFERCGHIADYEAESLNVLNGSLNLQSYDILILGSHMNHLNGNDLCDAIKKMASPNTKLVAMSSDSSEEFMSSTIKSGFDLIVRKPMTRNLVEHLVEVYDFIVDDSLIINEKKGLFIKDNDYSLVL